MRIIYYKGWRLLIAPGIEQEYAKMLFDTIKRQQYDTVSTLKDSLRSLVWRVSIHNKDLVYKIPVEKNNRVWIRFLTLFREGEAFKNLRSMRLMQSFDIKTTCPVLAAEKRQAGMVVDSWLLYNYLDGISCLNRPETYADVVKTLQNIHRRKLIHGDPQIRNFLKKDDTVYVIDTAPRNAGITGFDIGYEWVYLRKSAPDTESFFGNIPNTFWYRVAFYYDLLERKLVRIKKKIRKRPGFWK